MKRFKLNLEGRDFFVGDIHGEVDLLLRELEALKFNPAMDRVFSVGDLIDRGSDSYRSLMLLNQPWFHAVRGNHEDFLEDPLVDPYLWYINGGSWSAEIEDLEPLRELVRTKMHPVFEVETPYGVIGVVHAESMPVWSDNGTPQAVALNRWGRTKVKRKDTSVVKGIDAVVVGHTVVPDPLPLGNVLHIDTGAVFGDRLTILTPKQVFQWLE